jgi:Beta-lactamase enzyme family
MVTRRRAWIGGGPCRLRRGFRRVPLAAAVTLGVFAGTVAGLPAVSAPAVTRGAVPSALAQLHWLVRASARAPVPAGQIRGHFNAVELAEVGGPAVVNQVLEETGALGLRRLLLDHPAGVEGFVSSSVGVLLAEVVTGTSGLIDFLSLVPNHPAPRTWQRIDAAVEGLAPQVSFAAMVIGHGGRCRVVNGIHAAAARPVGSAFKLYVLGAIARAVATHRLSWNQQFALRKQWLSHGGVLVADAPGTRFTVSQYAGYMMSISDNTAATSLIDIAGRGSVQAQLSTFGNAHPTRDIPFLTPRELIVLKGVNYPALADHYLALPRPRRTAELAAVDRIPLARAKDWTRPRKIGQIEWFASPTDICRAYAGLWRQYGQPGQAPIGGALSINPGSIALSPHAYPVVWFKGGSEPGVETLNYFTRAASGHLIVVSLMMADPSAPLSGPATTGEVIALARGAIQLANRAG